MQRTQSCVFGFNRKPPIFIQKAEYVGCATWQSRGVSDIRVFCRALGGASIETWILRLATFSILRLHAADCCKDKAQEVRIQDENHT